LRPTLIETGLLEMQGWLYRSRAPRRRTVPPPDRHDELDPASTINGFAVTGHDHELVASPWVRVVGNGQCSILVIGP
jgi:hypothetical protein